MRTIDWAALAVFAFEAPSLLFSQYRANSVSAAEAIGVAVLAYFVIRLAIHTRPRAAWLAALLGVGGAGLAFSGLRQFATGEEPLAEVGLTELVAFRSRLVHPIHGWVPGECFTLFRLALPFACAAAAYLRRNGSPQAKAAQAVVALVNWKEGKEEGR